MLPTVLIAFREFLEAFLIAGVFLGLSKQLDLKKEFEIIAAVATGVVGSFALAIGTYLIGSAARADLSASGADLWESYLLIFSGIFIGYVAFSLHRTMGKAHQDAVKRAKETMKERAFDAALFFTIVALVLREGFEIALFTASVSLFSDFLGNLFGLLIGFALAAVVGTVVFFAYTKFPIKKVFMLTEYAIIALGAVMTASGITKLLVTQFGIDTASWVAVPTPFTDNPVSLIPVLLVLAYIGVIYVLFLKKPKVKMVN